MNSVLIINNAKITEISIENRDKCGLPSVYNLLLDVYCIDYICFGYHRMDGPARICDFAIEWCVNGRTHRDDGAAFISFESCYFNGIKQYKN